MEKLAKLAREIADEFCGGSEAVTDCINAKLLSLMQPAEPQGDARVQNSDVDAAQAWLNHAHGDSDEVCPDVDSACLTKAFALHRQAAEQRATRAALEAAAKLVEQYNLDLMERWNEVTKEAPLQDKIRALIAQEEGSNRPAPDSAATKERDDTRRNF